MADLLQRMKRSLRPARRRFEYRRKAVLLTLFRYAILLARALHILPGAATANAAPHILVINLTPHLGDAILLMPLLEQLRLANPAVRIDFAVEAGGAALLREMPQLDHIYALPLGSAPPITLWQSIARAFAITHVYWTTLRDVRPTVTVNPRWGDDLFRSSLLALLMGAPTRIAFAASVATPAPYRDRLSTMLVDGGHGLHDPVRFLSLAAAADLLPAEALTRISDRPIATLQQIASMTDWTMLQTRFSLPNAAFAIIAPGASMPRRAWPLDRWQQVAEALLAQGLNVVLLAGTADAGLAAALHARLRQRSTLLAGATSLLESTALLAHAALFLGSDSGPGHIAGALGIPSVILFANVAGTNPDHPSSPERVRPTGPHVVCLAPPRTLSPCTNACQAEVPHCITLIEPAEVMEAVAILLRTGVTGA